MNRDAFAEHRRNIKTRCFERTIRTLVRTRQIPASEGELSEAVSGFSNQTWALITAIANRTHDCGVDHEVPSEDTQYEIVNVFTEAAIHAERVDAQIERAIRDSALRAARHMQVLS